MKDAKIELPELQNDIKNVLIVLTNDQKLQKHYQ